MKHAQVRAVEKMHHGCSPLLVLQAGMPGHCRCCYCCSWWSWSRPAVVPLVEGYPKEAVFHNQAVQTFAGPAGSEHILHC
jgi:hypothetical protein